MCHNPSVYLCKLLFLEDRVIQSKSPNREPKLHFCLSWKVNWKNASQTFFQDVTQFNQIPAGLETLVDSSQGWKF